MVDLASPFLRLQKGTSVLLNVLNRADTNGDGVLAKEEFLNFFWDAILTEDELCGLFDHINVHNTGFIDAAELSSFVWQHLGGLSGLLASLEDLSAAASKGLHYVKQSYETGNVHDQFVMRFVIREATFQLTKFLESLQAAQQKFQENGIPLIDGSDDDDVEPQDVQPQKSMAVYKACQSLRLPVRVRKQVLTQTSVDLEESSQELNVQIKKLETIVEKLANQPRFKRPQERELDITDETLIFLVQQTLPVDEQQLDSYRNSLEHYTSKTAACPGCLLISVRFYKDISTYAVYEIWETEDLWNVHLRSPTYKALQHQNIESLRKPEFLNTMEIPGKICHLAKHSELLENSMNHTQSPFFLDRVMVGSGKRSLSRITFLHMYNKETCIMRYTSDLSLYSQDRTTIIFFLCTPSLTSAHCQKILSYTSNHPSFLCVLPVRMSPGSSKYHRKELHRKRATLN